ncbi:MAG: potassium/proton antiporter [Candidatus Limivicinus sp.]
MNLPIFLLILAAIIFLCIITHRISRRIGVPTLLLFILLGTVFGSDGIFKIPFENYAAAERICSVALLYIIFYGGFGTRWTAAKPVAAKAVLLSSAGTVLTACLTAVFCRWILKMDILDGLLLGSVLGSTDAASVFFILRSKKLNLKDGCASLLEMESGSNDPFAYMMTVIVLSAMGGKLNGRSAVSMLILQLAAGAAAGFGIGFLASKILSRRTAWGNGIDTIFVFGTALLSYALPQVLGGNGYLSAYITGIILGNQDLDNKKSLVNFFDALNGLMQMILFFLLGLLACPSQMKPVILPAFAVAMILTFAARPIAVAVLMLPFRVNWRQYIVLSWAGLRGAASIVFAIMVVNNPSCPGYDIFHIVFCVVLISILLQGTLLPAVSRRCGMIDEKEDIMRTFSDYTEERQVQFVQTCIDGKHPWANKMISQVKLLPNMLIAVLIRDGQTTVPHGSTRLQPGDIAIICTQGLSELPDVMLKEIRITADHRWCGKSLSQDQIAKNALVIMVKRGKELVIPNGDTRLLENDVVIIYVKPKEKKKFVPGRLKAHAAG